MTRKSVKRVTKKRNIPKKVVLVSKKMVSGKWSSFFLMFIDLVQKRKKTAMQDTQKTQAKMVRLVPYDATKLFKSIEKAIAPSSEDHGYIIFEPKSFTAAMNAIGSGLMEPTEQ